MATTAQATMMFCLILLVFLCCCITVNTGGREAHSFSLSVPSSSREYGGRDGYKFTHAWIQRNGPITAIRIRAVWEFIVGLQIRYGQRWSQYVGGSYGVLQEVPLFKGEYITQVTGSYGVAVYKLEFITDQGRRLSFGKSHGISFNAFPPKKGMVLRYVSGRSSDYFLDAIRFHWDVKPKKSRPGRMEE